MTLFRKESVALILTIVFTLMIQNNSFAKVDFSKVKIEEAPEWIYYPDLAPTKLEVFHDATSDNPRDILVCLTIANKGLYPVKASDHFEIYRQYAHGSSNDVYQDTVQGPLGSGYLSTNNTIVLEYTPRLPGTGSTYTGTDPIAITYTVDFDNDIAESRENNNQITTLYSVSAAEERESCFDE